MNININTNYSNNYIYKKIKSENKEDSKSANYLIKTSESYSDTKILSDLTEQKVKQEELKKILVNLLDEKQKYKNTTLENFVFEEALKAFKNITVPLTEGHYKALLKLLKKEPTTEDIMILARGHLNQRVWFYLKQLLSYPQYHSYYLSQILEDLPNKLRNKAFDTHTLTRMIDINFKMWELSCNEIKKWDKSLVEYHDQDFLLKDSEDFHKPLLEYLYSKTSESLQESTIKIKNCIDACKILCTLPDGLDYTSLPPYKKKMIRESLKDTSSKMSEQNQKIDEFIEKSKIQAVESKIIKRDFLIKKIIKTHSSYLKSIEPEMMQIVHELPRHLLHSFTVEEFLMFCGNFFKIDKDLPLIAAQFIHQCIDIEKKQGRRCNPEEIDKVLQAIEFSATEQIKTKLKDFSAETANFSTKLNELNELRNNFNQILEGFLDVNRTCLAPKSSNQEKVSVLKQEIQPLVSNEYKEENLDIWNNETTSKKKKKKKNKSQSLKTPSVNAVKKESPKVKKASKPTSKMTLITSQNQDTISKKEITPLSKEQIFEAKKTEIFRLLKDGKKELFLLAFVGLLAERIHDIKSHQSKNGALDQEVIDHLLLASLGIENLLKALQKKDLLQFAGTYPMLLMDWHVQVEQCLNQVYSESNEKFPFHHSLVSRSQEVNQWEKLKDTEKQYLSDLDLGLLWARYPMNFIGINKDKNLKMLSYLDQILNADWIEPNALKAMLTDVANLQVRTLEWLIKFYGLEKEFNDCLSYYNKTLNTCLLKNSEYLTKDSEITKLPLYNEANKIAHFIEDKTRFFAAPKELLDVSAQLKKFQATVLSLKDQNIPLYQEAWHYRNAMFVQWLFEKIYHSRLQLLGQESKEHSFAILELKLDEKFSFKNFLTQDFFFDKAIHYPRISEIFSHFQLTPALKTYRKALDTMFYRITHLVNDGFQLAGASKEPKGSEAVIEKAKQLVLKAQDVLCKEIGKLEIDMEKTLW